MKFKRISMFLMVILSIALFITSPASVFAMEGETLTILFTHDLHSYFDTKTVHTGESDIEIGGFAKIKTVIDQVKAEKPNTIVLDAGDFAMGTLYQTLFTTHAAELRLFGAMGVNVTTLGNHEFDYGSDKLAEMLRTAQQSKEALPAIVQANIDWNNSSGKYTSQLKEAMSTYGAKEYVMIESGGLKIAIFGLLGKDAAASSPAAGLAFMDTAESAKSIIKVIKNQDNPDLIICLSHSGTNEKPSKSEDELLAKAVPEIDVIISGHSHTTLKTPIRYGSTLVISAGEYGQKLGRLDLKRDATGRWQAADYQLIQIDQTIANDAVLFEKIQAFKSEIQPYLAKFGFNDMDEVLAHNPYEFTTLRGMYASTGEQPLGNLIADSYIYAIKQAEGDAYIPIDVAVVPRGVIRSYFMPGDITVAHAYEISSLGIGPDGYSGYPLMSIYLTGAELKTVAEIDASISMLMSGARLYWSGLYSEFNSKRMPLNKVTNVMLMDESGVHMPLEDGKLYRVVVGLYSGKMLGNVTALSKGLLSIAPKDKAGVPFEDFDNAIAHGQNGEEIKEWNALAVYLASFPKNDSGIPEIPAKYQTTLGRKVDTNSSNLFDLITQPNKFSFIILGIVFLILLVVILIIRMIVKLVLKLIRRK